VLELLRVQKPRDADGTERDDDHQELADEAHPHDLEQRQLHLRVEVLRRAVEAGEEAHRHDDQADRSEAIPELVCRRRPARWFLHSAKAA